MANVRVDSPITIFDGQALTFRSPADCSMITGLIVYYPAEGATLSRVFQFADAHGNNIGDLDLFAADVVVKVILDTDTDLAFVQNADTNAYLESRFDSKASTTTYTVSATAEWMEDDMGGYMQMVDIDGILATDNPVADVVLGDDVDANALYKAAWSLVDRIVTDNDVVVLYANSEAPTTAFTFQLKVVR